MSRCLRLSALFLALPSFAFAQTIGAGLQPEYVIVTADRAQTAIPPPPTSQVSAAKA